MTANTRMLQTAQRGLPLVLCTLGVLELGAVVFGPGVRLDPAGILAGVGPGAFVPVTLAVVFATLLRASADTLMVKAATAVASGVFLAARAGLAVVLVMSGADLGVAELLTLVSGTVLGLALAIWSAIEFRAAQLLVAAEAARGREGDARYLPEPEIMSPPSPSPVASPTRPRAPAPAGPAHGSSAPASAPTPTTVIRPALPGSALQASSVRSTSPASAAASLWHRGSTPWPRRNEEDPDGTLLRPPRRH